MCNCIEETTNILKAKIEIRIKREVGFKKIDFASFDNCPLLMICGNVKTSPFYVPFTVEYTKKAKSSGKIRTYKEKVNFFPAYCPFCGEKYG